MTIYELYKNNNNLTKDVIIQKRADAKKLCEKIQSIANLTGKSVVDKFGGAHL